MTGTTVHAHPHLPEFSTEYRIAKQEHCFTYDKADEVWLKYFGYMVPVLTDKPVIFAMGGELYTHPNNLERIKRQLSAR